MFEMPDLVFKVYSALLEDVRDATSKSHVREVAAAMLGYGTYAAYLTDVDAGVDHASADHLVLQPAHAHLRANQLKMSHQVATDVCGQIGAYLVETAGGDEIGPRVHLSMEEFRDSVLCDELRESVSDSDEVMAAFAHTNAYDEYGPDIEEVTWDEELLNARGSWAVEGTGSITGAPDPDRAYSGHVIDFAITRNFEVVGRCGLVFMEDDIGAGVRDDRRGDDDE